MKKIMKTFEFKGIPVSKQGQITLPKAIRECLGINLESSKKPSINISLINDSIVIEAEPSVDDVFGILQSPSRKPVDINELREALARDRSRELGYTISDD